MAGLRFWLRPPRSLLVLFVIVTLMPAVTLVFLGIRLLQQDRALADQRRLEILDRAADQAVRALQQDLASTDKRLKSDALPASGIPDGAVFASLRTDTIEVVPVGRIPYYPDEPVAKEPPDAPFETLEELEFRKQDLAGALRLAVSLADSADPLIRAGALLRKARLLRKMERPEEALETYHTLAKSSAWIGGLPADLVALRGRCTVLEEQSRKAELRQEAGHIADGLRLGKWRLNRISFVRVAGQVADWSGEEIRTDPESQALASAMEWLRRSQGGEEWPAEGARVQNFGGTRITVRWISGAGWVRAFLAGPRYMEAHWLPEMQGAAAPARAFVMGYAEGPPAGLRKVKRAAAETGLPWTLLVTEPGLAGWGDNAGTRNLLLSGLALLVAMIAGVSYLIWRSTARELAVATLQSDFVAAVSHEFRTPLTSLRQFQDLLADEDVPPEKRRVYHDAEVRATDRLQRLVEELLDFGRMESGRHPYRFELLNAGSLAQEVVADFRREAAPRDFALNCAADGARCIVRADPEALSRALWNLLDNAVKYGGESRNIDVIAKRNGGAVLLTVSDHGLGIPAGERKRIFEKFVRGEAARSRNIKGTGLGLAMVKHIVEAHGGRIQVESTLGKGSAFTISLPASE